MPRRTFSSVLCLLATTARGEVCDKVEGVFTLPVIVGPAACGVALLLVVVRWPDWAWRAAAVGLGAAALGWWAMADARELVHLAAAEPCGPSLAQDAALTATSLAVLSLLPLSAIGARAWRRRMPRH
jgi:hypothetical protein